MTNQPPLNPDALEAASRAIDPEAWEVVDKHRGDPGAERLRASLISEATAQVSVYLAAALPEVTQSEELSILIGDVKTAIDHEHIDPREFIDLNDVLWALEAQVVPEVTSVEELDQLPIGSAVLSEKYIAQQEDEEYPCVFQKLYTGDWHRGGRSSDTHPDYFLPARVLYRPSEAP